MEEKAQNPNNTQPSILPELNDMVDSIYHKSHKIRMIFEFGYFYRTASAGIIKNNYEKWCKVYDESKSKIQPEADGCIDQTSIMVHETMLFNHFCGESTRMSYDSMGIKMEREVENLLSELSKLVYEYHEKLVIYFSTGVVNTLGNPNPDVNDFTKMNGTMDKSNASITEVKNDPVGNAVDEQIQTSDSKLDEIDASGDEIKKEAIQNQNIDDSEKPNTVINDEPKDLFDFSDLDLKDGDVDDDADDKNKGDVLKSTPIDKPIEVKKVRVIKIKKSKKTAFTMAIREHLKMTVKDTNNFVNGVYNKKHKSILDIDKLGIDEFTQKFDELCEFENFLEN